MGRCGNCTHGDAFHPTFCVVCEREFQCGTLSEPCDRPGCGDRVSTDTDPWRDESTVYESPRGRS